MSTHKRALQQVVDDLMAEDPEYCAVLARYLKLMKSGSFDRSYLDSVLQKWGGASYDFYDAYAFCRFHSLYCSGEIATAAVVLGKEPGGDGEVAYHNRVLQKRAGSPFGGEFWGGLADSDGCFGWDAPIQLEIKRCSLTDETVERASIERAPQQLPLEVGYTEGSCTLRHLALHGGVARWPYGSEALYLYVRVGENPLGALFSVESGDDE